MMRLHDPLRSCKHVCMCVVHHTSGVHPAALACSHRESTGIHEGPGLKLFAPRYGFELKFGAKASQNHQGPCNSFPASAAVALKFLPILVFRGSNSKSEQLSLWSTMPAIMVPRDDFDLNLYWILGQHWATSGYFQQTFFLASRFGNPHPPPRFELMIISHRNVTIYKLA